MADSLGQDCRLQSGRNCVTRKCVQEGLDKGAIPFLPAILLPVWGAACKSFATKGIAVECDIDTLAVKREQHWRWRHECCLHACRHNGIVQISYLMSVNTPVFINLNLNLPH